MSVGCEIWSARIFEKMKEASNLGDKISFPKIFCCINIQLKEQKSSNFIDFHIVSLKDIKVIWKTVHRHSKRFLKHSSLGAHDKFGCLC